MIETEIVVDAETLRDGLMDEIGQEVNRMTPEASRVADAGLRNVALLHARGQDLRLIARAVIIGNEIDRMLV